MPTFNDWVLRYGILLGKRFTKKQRKNFLRSAQKEFAEMGYDVDVTRSECKVAMGAKKEYFNLYAGDFDQARVVIATYYDTPAKSFGCYKYEAFQQFLPRKNAILNAVLSLLILLIGCVMLYTWNLQRIAAHGLYNLFGVFTLLLFVGMLFLITRYRDGIPNRCNMVRNTSSILAAFAFAKNLSASKKQDVCFAFIDGATHSAYGHQMLMGYLEAHPSKKVIYLDAVGNPGEVQVFSKKPATAHLKEASLHACSESMHVAADYLVTAGIFRDGVVHIPKANTRKDSELDETAVMSVVRTLRQLTSDLLAKKQTAQNQKHIS